MIRGQNGAQIRSVLRGPGNRDRGKGTALGGEKRARGGAENFFVLAAEGEKKWEGAVVGSTKKHEHCLVPLSFGRGCQDLCCDWAPGEFVPTADETTAGGLEQR